MNRRGRPKIHLMPNGPHDWKRTHKSRNPRTAPLDDFAEGMSCHYVYGDGRTWSGVRGKGRRVRTSQPPESHVRPRQRDGDVQWFFIANAFVPDGRGTEMYYNIHYTHTLRHCIK